jgi:HlyD family secretion protein
MSSNTPDSPNNIGEVLGYARRGNRQRQAMLWIAGLIVLGLAAWGGLAFFSNDPAELKFETAEVRQGDLTVNVTATGTLQPVNQVDVGTEISGTVQSLSADFNDRVKRGQVLAKLNTDQLSARLRQSQAALQLARANVKNAQATQAETRAKLKRFKTLAAKAIASQDDLDTAEAAYTRATAGVQVSKEQVSQAEAQVDADRTTLDKAQIRSPIDGIVLKRQVELGQTVAASLQTPVLFTLAENLTQMELNVAVDEADVGQVKVGQHASFNVDAFPGRSFPAVIDQVRYAPQTVAGVVTYETVLLVDNSDLSLRPGMTATVEIVVGEYHNVLLLPNTALRFTPPAPQTKTASGGSLFSRLFPRRPHKTNETKREAASAKNAQAQKVWTLQNDKPVKIAVTVGATDGQMTQLLSGEVQAGMALLVDVIRTQK